MASRAGNNAQKAAQEAQDKISGLADTVTAGSNILADSQEQLGNLASTGSNFLSQGQQNLQGRIASSLPGSNFIAGGREQLEGIQNNVTGASSNFLSQGQQQLDGHVANASNLLGQGQTELQDRVAASLPGADLLAQGREQLDGHIASGSNLLRQGQGNLAQGQRNLQGNITSSFPSTNPFAQAQDQIEGIQGDITDAGANFLADGQDQLEGHVADMGSNFLGQKQRALEDKITASIPTLPTMPNMPNMPNMPGSKFLSQSQDPTVAATRAEIENAKAAAKDLVPTIPNYNDIAAQGRQNIANAGNDLLAQGKEGLASGLAGAIPGLPDTDFLGQGRGKLQGSLPSGNIPNQGDLEGDIVASLPGADFLSNPSEKLNGVGDGYEERLQNGVDGYEKKLQGGLDGYDQKLEDGIEGYKNILQGYIDSWLARLRDRIYRVPRSTPPTEPEIERWEARTKLINIIANYLMIIFFLLFLILIMILFFDASLYHNSSLVGPQKAKPKQPQNNSTTDVVANQLGVPLPTASFLDGIQPQVLVTLLATALIAIASMLISRFVEHDMWLRKGCTPQEVKLKAKWPHSPPVRIAYFTMGDSNTLKLAGLLMIPFIIVPTVLIAGISQTNHTTVNIKELANSSSIYSGFLEGGQSLFFAGNPGAETAAIASLQGLTLPPSSDTPCGSDDNCNVNAKVGAVKATCSSGTQRNALTQDKPLFTLNSKLNNSLSVELTSVGGQYASFMSSTYPSRSWLLEQLALLAEQDPSATNTSGSQAVASVASVASPSATGLSKRQTNLLNGTNTQTSLDSYVGGLFGVILGAYRDPGSSDVHTVECNLTFGTQIVTQNGKSAARLSDDFSQSKENFYTSEFKLPALTYAFDASSIWEFTATKTALDQQQGRVRGSVTGSPTIGWFLLWSNGSVRAPISPPNVVAENIVKAFDFYTLLAFIKTPGASSMTATSSVSVARYVYNGWFLFILVAPVAAVIFAAVGRTKVGGAHTVPGYDPLAIAQQGFGALDLDGNGDDNTPAAAVNPTPGYEKNPRVAEDPASPGIPERQNQLS